MPALPQPDYQPDVVKVWETVNDEYVYWEDILIDPVRQFGDTQWVAFRHLFTEKQLLSEFDDSEKLQRLKSKNRMEDSSSGPRRAPPRTPSVAAAP